MTDEEILKLHGDNSRHSIAEWRQEFNEGKTSLEYINWRADRLWCETQIRRI